MATPKRKRKVAIFSLIGLAVAVLVVFGAMKARGNERRNRSCRSRSARPRSPTFR